MSEQFAGLCVGGPYAGKQIVEITGTFKVEERVRTPILTRIEGKVFSLHPPGIKTHIYRSQMVGTVGLWIHESMTGDQALQEIAAGYIAACKQVDSRVTPSFSR